MTFHLPPCKTISSELAGKNPDSGVSKPAVEMLGVGTRWGSQQSPSRLGEEGG